MSCKIDNACQAMTLGANTLVDAANEMFGVSGHLHEGTVVLRDGDMLRTVTFAFDPFTGTAEIHVGLHVATTDGMMEQAEAEKPH